MTHVTTNAVQKFYIEANRRFVDFYLNYVQGHGLNLDSLKEELANFLKALSVCERHQWWQKLCRLVEGVKFLLQDLGYWVEYRYWLEVVLRQQALLNQPEDQVLYLGLLEDYASLLHTQGEREQALTLYRDVMALAAQQNQVLILAYAHFGLGQVYFSSGQLEKAKEHWQLAVSTSQELKEMGVSVITEFLLNSVSGNAGSMIKVSAGDGKPFPEMALIESHLRARHYFDQQRLAEAQQAYQMVCTLARQLDDQDGLALALFHLGEIARMTDQLSQAIRYYRESERIALRLNNHIGLSSIYAGIGRVYLLSERYDLARPYLEECVRLEREFGDNKALAENLYLLGYAAANTGDPPYAEVCFQQTRAIFASIEPNRVSEVDDVLDRLHTAVASAQ